MDKLHSLSEIFHQYLFRIPDYQRGYAWRANEQVAAFWDDLNNLQPDRKHYTGLLSIAHLSEKDTQGWNDEQWLIKKRGFNPVHVVDGQQRLTTAIILIQALYDFVKSIHPEEEDEDIYLGQSTLEEIKKQFISLTEKRGVITTYIFGYESDNPSYEFLKNRIFHDSTAASTEETYYTLNLENAYVFFMTNLRNLYNQEGEDGLSELFQKLTQSMVFNLFEIDSVKKDFDVFAAFETMNNRGKKLSTLELLKNRLIYLTTLYSDAELDYSGKVSLRSQINDAWKVVYEQLGKKKTSPLDDDEFLQAHWILTFPYSRTTGINFAKDLLEDKFSISKVQKKKSDSTGITEAPIIVDDELEDESAYEDKVVESELKPREIKEYVLGLSNAAVKWFYTWFPNDAGTFLTDEEKYWIENLNRINIAYFRPLITAALIANLSPKSRVKLFKAVERFIFIAFRCQSAQSNYRNSEYFRYARLLRMSPKPEETNQEIIDTLVNNLRYAFNEVPGNPAECFFKSSYLRNSMERKDGRYYEWGALHYFLYEYERSLANEGDNRRPLPKWEDFVKSSKTKISIEHILPQTPDNDYWKQMFKDVPEEQLSNLKGSLGNLMLLSQSINSSLQNDSFPEKKIVKYGRDNTIARQGYSNGSYSEQEVAQYQDWTEDTIKERGLKMLSFMEKRWDMRIASEKERLNILFIESKE